MEKKRVKKVTKLVLSDPPGVIDLAAYNTSSTIEIQYEINIDMHSRWTLVFRFL